VVRPGLQALSGAIFLFGYLVPTPAKMVQNPGT
jgi:hypothetical protein